MKFGELSYRDCGYCHTVSVSMNLLYSNRHIRDARGAENAVAVYSCPRCGGVTLVKLAMGAGTTWQGDPIIPSAEVVPLQVTPSSDDFGLSVKHLPPDVQRFFEDAQRGLMAGLPDAAAVALRKTLEAAAAKKGIDDGTLFARVKKLIAEGYITTDFGAVLDHVRKIGNLGAHYTDTPLDVAEVERSLRFTTQVLRNLFEVPGELAELNSATLEVTADLTATAEVS